jgi:hypothetical protein
MDENDVTLMVILICALVSHSYSVARYKKMDRKTEMSWILCSLFYIVTASRHHPAGVKLPV